MRLSKLSVSISQVEAESEPIDGVYVEQSSLSRVRPFVHDFQVIHMTFKVNLKYVHHFQSHVYDF